MLPPSQRRKDSNILQRKQQVSTAMNSSMLSLQETFRFEAHLNLPMCAAGIVCQGHSALQECHVLLLHGMDVWKWNSGERETFCCCSLCMDASVNAVLKVMPRQCIACHVAQLVSSVWHENIHRRHASAGSHAAAPVQLHLALTAAALHLITCACRCSASS